MTAEINKAVERLTRQMFDADTHYGSDRLGWMVGDVATEDLRLVISELSRLREDNATLTLERDEALEALEPFAARIVDIGESEDDGDRFNNGLSPFSQSVTIKVGDIRRAAILSRQSKEGGE